MLKNITWMDYISGVVTTLVIYYIFIAVRYYADDLKDLLSGERKTKMGGALKNDNSKANIDTYQPESTGFEETSDNEFEEVENLVESIKKAIAESCKRKLIPQEFRQNMQTVLKEYPSLKYSSLRPSINELIKSECEKSQATATMDIGDVDLLW